MPSTESPGHASGARTLCLLLGALIALSLFVPWIQNEERTYLGFQWFLAAISGGDAEADGGMWVSKSRAMFPTQLIPNLVGVVLCLAAGVSCARRRSGPLGLANRFYCIVGAVLLVPMTTTMLATRANEGATDGFYNFGWYLVTGITAGFLLLGILAPRAIKYD